MLRTCIGTLNLDSSISLQFLRIQVSMRKRLGSHVPQSHLELEMTLSKIIKMFNIIWENILVFNCEIIGQSFARKFKFTHKVFKL